MPAASCPCSAEILPERAASSSSSPCARKKRTQENPTAPSARRQASRAGIRPSRNRRRSARRLVSVCCVSRLFTLSSATCPFGASGWVVETPVISSSQLTPSTRASSCRLSMPGSERFDSHLPIACRETPISAASFSWERPARFRSRAIRSPIVISIEPPFAGSFVMPAGSAVSFYHKEKRPQPTSCGKEATGGCGRHPKREKTGSG